MDNLTFEKFINAAKKNKKILYNPKFFGEYEDIITAIYNGVEKFDIYSFDGQLQDILIKVTKRFVPESGTNMYDQFLMEIYNELKQLVLPVVIIIPLNNFKINLTTQQCYKLTENIRIFQPEDSEADDAFSRYYKKVTHSDVNKHHILAAKDKNFFHYPIMTVCVNNIPFKVNEQSARITEAVYSFMRMMDFSFDVENDLFATHKPYFEYLPANTYCVYYTITKPYLYECGYSFRFKFDYFLDINSKQIKTHSKSFKSLLNRYINYCFMDRRHKTDAELQRIDTWLNAVLLYNSAYELASVERYDLANITLLTILESLFLKKSDKEKRVTLVNFVTDFIISKNNSFKACDIESLITDTYKHRNHFVHEGKNYYNARSYKALSERQGVMLGMKPFSHGTSCSFETYKNLQSLIKMVGYIIMTFWD